MKWTLPKNWAKWKQALARYRTILLVVAVGLALMLLPTGSQETTASEVAPEADSVTDSFDLEAFEAKLSLALSQIQGAGEVRVVLTLKSGSRTVLAQDVEQTGERVTTTAVTLGKGSSTQEVVALQTLSPQFQGALVVCPGGGEASVRLQLTQAVSALTGLSSDKISVCKGEN